MKSWDPFRDLVTIQDRMNKLFESVLSGPVDAGVGTEGVGYWRPVADVLRSGDAVEIECELAGVELDEVDVSAKGNVLAVRGERTRSEEAESWRFHRLERPHGTFLRRFELPEETDLSRMEVALDGGILRIVAPVRATAAPRSLDN